jgi:DNA-directed RNA polymerase specialized sigma24 family protein
LVRLIVGIDRGIVISGGRMLYEEEKVRYVILRYLQGIFALAFYLTSGEQDTAYEVCAESFTEALDGGSSLDQEEDLLNRLASIVVIKSRRMKVIPSFDNLDILEVPSIEKGPLRIVLNALQSMDFDAKAVLLLRDQLCLSYKNIAVIMQTSQASARHMTTQARLQLRQRIEDIMSHAERG